MTETALLWLLGIFITILLALLGVLYNTIIGTIKEIKENQKEDQKETWKELDRLKEGVPIIDSRHQLMCQKHEDRMDAMEATYKRIDIAVHDRLDTIETKTKTQFEVIDSKLKSQGDFFNTRIQELIQTIKNKRL